MVPVIGHYEKKVEGDITTHIPKFYVLESRVQDPMVDRGIVVPAEQGKSDRYVLFEALKRVIPQKYHGNIKPFAKDPEGKHLIAFNVRAGDEVYSFVPFVCLENPLELNGSDDVKLLTSSGEEDFVAEMLNGESTKDIREALELVIGEFYIQRPSYCPVSDWGPDKLM